MILMRRRSPRMLFFFLTTPSNMSKGARIGTRRARPESELDFTEKCFDGACSSQSLESTCRRQRLLLGHVLEGLRIDEAVLFGWSHSCDDLLDLLGLLLLQGRVLVDLLDLLAVGVLVLVIIVIVVRSNLLRRLLDVELIGKPMNSECFFTRSAECGSTRYSAMSSSS